MRPGHKSWKLYPVCSRVWSLCISNCLIPPFQCRICNQECIRLEEQIKDPWDQSKWCEHPKIDGVEPWFSLIGLTWFNHFNLPWFPSVQAQNPPGEGDHCQTAVGRDRSPAVGAPKWQLFWCQEMILDYFGLYLIIHDYSNFDDICIGLSCLPMTLCQILCSFFALLRSFSQNDFVSGTKTVEWPSRWAPWLRRRQKYGPFSPGRWNGPFWPGRGAKEEHAKHLATGQTTGYNGFGKMHKNETDGWTEGLLK